MQHPVTLLNDVLILLQAIPELQDVDIDVYDIESSINKSQDEAKDALFQGAMLIYEGGEWKRDEMQGITHQFSMVIKASDDMSAYTIVQHIMSGIPSGGNNLPFVEQEITGCLPFDEFSFSPALDGDGNQYIELRFTAQEI